MEKEEKKYGKRYIDGRPAQGEKLLGDPVAVQSLAAMVQAIGVRLSPAIHREEQTTNRVRKCGEKVNLLTISFCLGWMLRLSLKPTVVFIQFRHP